jgi:uncharacterized SAM-binding protein YcdF (DUF218 family)
VLGRFLGRRDVDALDQTELDRAIGHARADVMVLYGGSVLGGVDVLADAMRADVARTYVISGGAGHTTATLRETVRRSVPGLDVPDDVTEAELLASVLERRHGLTPDLLETRSTNCGNNITFVLDLLAEREISARDVIICQDATMQLRMDAGMRAASPETTVVDYATYEVEVACVADHGSPLALPLGGTRGAIDYVGDVPEGMWDVGRYLTLLMGEVPRLRDDGQGYGPKGRGWIAHVDVPEAVLEAQAALSSAFPASVRTADPAYAGPASEPSCDRGPC